MGYDKLVDSAKLDAALTATADAIRSKTSGTQKIAWDAIKGFADAIASASKVASGTFTPSFPGYDENFSLTISGLGFKPTTVILLALAPHDDGGLEGRCLYAIFNEGSTTSWYAYASTEEEELEDENGDPYINYTSYMYMYSDGIANIAANDDGFVLTNAENGWNGELAFDYPYLYYAF